MSNRYKHYSNHTRYSSLYQAHNSFQSLKSPLKFLQLPRELRDQIYTYYLSFNPIAHIGFTRIDETPSKPLTKHALILLNHQVSAEYLEAIYTSAEIVFHIKDPSTTNSQSKTPLRPCAYWTTPPILKHRLQSCRIHVTMTPAFAPKCSTAMSDLERDFESFLAELPNLEALTLRIDATAVLAGDTASGHTTQILKKTLEVVAFRKAGVQVVTVREGGMGVIEHRRNEDGEEGGWCVRRWLCTPALADESHVCEERCWFAASEAWHCGRIEHLDYLRCFRRCKEETRKLRARKEGVKE